MLNPKKIAEELKELYPYRIELHAHSSPASGCSEVPADELVRVFYEAGYDGIAITNHFISDNEHSSSKADAIEKFKKDLYLAYETGDKLGIKVTVAHDPEHCGAKGAGFMLKNIKKLEDNGYSFRLREQSF